MKKYFSIHLEVFYLSIAKSIMPDLIRHLGALEKTGFRLPFTGPWWWSPEWQAF